METEFEAKVLDVDIDSLRARLDSLGAEKRGDKEQKRYVYDFKPPREDSWVRLRTDGETTTLTVKEIHNDEVDGTKELEVEVSDFRKTHLLLRKLGYEAKGYQENRRESYLLDGLEVEIDSWPRIPPYVEVEGKSSEEVEETLKRLGFDPSEATSMNTTGVYGKYGIDLNTIKELKF